MVKITIFFCGNWIRVALAILFYRAYIYTHFLKTEFSQVNVITSCLTMSWNRGYQPIWNITRPRIRHRILHTARGVLFPFLRSSRTVCHPKTSIIAHTDTVVCYPLSNGSHSTQFPSYYQLVSALQYRFDRHVFVTFVRREIYALLRFIRLYIIV